jgi:hypothetical protein
MLTDKFLVPVVEGVVALLDIKGVNSRPLQGDTVLMQSAKTALSMVETYINRKLSKALYDERYDYVSTEILIRNTPIDVVSGVEITDIDEDVEITSEYFSVISNKLIRLSRFASSPLDNKSYRVVYTGGFTSLTEDSDILQGLISQTTAVYKRRDSTGISTYSGSDMTAVSSSDKGSLLQSVKDMLAYRVYYGSAR